MCPLDEGTPTGGDTARRRRNDRVGPPSEAAAGTPRRSCTKVYVGALGVCMVCMYGEYMYVGALGVCMVCMYGVYMWCIYIYVWCVYGRYI